MAAVQLRRWQSWRRDSVAKRALSLRLWTPCLTVDPCTPWFARLCSQERRRPSRVGAPEFSCRANAGSSSPKNPHRSGHQHSLSRVKSKSIVAGTYTSPRPDPACRSFGARRFCA
jgi:hypothetical protein